MVERSFRYLSNLSFTETPFKQFTIPPDFRAWEVSWLTRLHAVIDNPTVPARLIESGCIVDNVRNCTKACESADHMFSNPETLWNCLTLATVAVMTTNGPDTISNDTLASVDKEFGTGRLYEFWKRRALLKYVKCALQSCSDSKFGGCPPGLWAFQCQRIGPRNIKKLGRIMSTEYCDKADPGIDYDIAGPGIIVAYLIQFVIVLFFALCYKISKTWIRNFALISLLPFQGPARAVETALEWQKVVSRSTFGVAIASTLVDLQEAQAVFLGTISVAAIITFTNSSGTGLGNISSLLSWLANNLTLRGMISAGMYPLLFVQLILQKTHNRWWYTLALVFMNWVLAVLITRPQAVDEGSLLKHFTESSSLENCGNHTGPRTFCQTFNKPTERGSGSNDGGDSDHLDRDAKSFFHIHSRIQSPMHIIMAFLILDWLLATIRMHLFERGDWLSHKVHALMDRVPSRLKSLCTQRYFLIFTEAIWISMEALAIVMGVIGVQEFAAFMQLLSGGESGNESNAALSKWGFGQLVAVCVWIPVVLKFACLMIDGALPGWRKRLGQFIEITQRKETQQDGNDVVMETLLPFNPTAGGQRDEREWHEQAFRHAVQRFPQLTNVTVTPAAHGFLFMPLFQTPMIRALPFGFVYPVIRTWPSDEALGYGSPENCPEGWGNDDERKQWRGFCTVTNVLVDYADSLQISELVVDNHTLPTGIDYTLFDKPNAEYDSLCKIVARPDFRRIVLSLTTGCRADFDAEDWNIYRNGRISCLLAKAIGLEEVVLKSDYGLNSWSCPIQDSISLFDLFPIEDLSRRHPKHFGLSGMQVAQDDLISFLGKLPPTLKSVNLSFLSLAEGHGNHADMLANIRDKLSWRNRPASQRIKVSISMKLNQYHKGRYVCLDKEVQEYLYGDGPPPFIAQEGRAASLFSYGTGIVHDEFDPSFVVPYETNRRRLGRRVGHFINAA
ncbi:hypothetical protein SNK03_000021 [Fusarium graminearum]|uniref:Chromosome 1, complete genome n=1 Tax=Gibberella zeae (strain ATCC MYA-4620 / CBS 123657 / FGSC 9075 / NRRL 31084 / PH-1) TaxID=229533 RepID=I1R976_GIBZE|nr:hypothetical protein FGSG_00003 [Fusarium graminearum PH-1]ESU05097.1 hypothetical protein FGSG_00003 [Fusarium graminearum PH-1]CEF71820.1 unnamed protein product [Fusarium graminearum]|eukprot:XP_011315582.1 hypothetical protein FGSG_00003 [Fusarium graminearum PH-1]